MNVSLSFCYYTKPHLLAFSSRCVLLSCIRLCRNHVITVRFKGSETSFQDLEKSASHTNKILSDLLGKTRNESKLEPTKQKAIDELIDSISTWPDQPQPQPQPEKRAQKRILLVDDEPDITLPYRVGLEDNGFVVDTFNDSVMALSNFKAGFYDLLLLDVKMPKMNGFELYTLIREKDDKVKVTFITAFDVRKENLASLNMSDERLAIIRKPIAIGDLVTRVKYELDYIV